MCEAGDSATSRPELLRSPSPSTLWPAPSPPPRIPRAATRPHRAFLRDRPRRSSRGSKSAPQIASAAATGELDRVRLGLISRQIIDPPHIGRRLGEATGSASCPFHRHSRAASPPPARNRRWPRREHRLRSAVRAFVASTIAAGRSLRSDAACAVVGEAGAEDGDRVVASLLTEGTEQVAPPPPPPHVPRPRRLFARHTSAKAAEPAPTDRDARAWANIPARNRLAHTHFRASPRCSNETHWRHQAFASANPPRRVSERYPKRSVESSISPETSRSSRRITKPPAPPRGKARRSPQPWPRPRIDGLGELFGDERAEIFGHPRSGPPALRREGRPARW